MGGGELPPQVSCGGRPGFSWRRAYWYAFIKARKITRVFFRGRNKLFYILAPLVQITATAGYVSATILVEDDMLPAGQGVSMGSSVMFSFGACLLSAVPCVIVSFMLGTLHVEKVNEIRSDQKKFAKENPELYGSTDTSMPMASVQGAEFGQQQGPWQTQGQWQPQGPWQPQGWQPQGQWQPQNELVKLAKMVLAVEDGDHGHAPIVKEMSNVKLMQATAETALASCTEYTKLEIELLIERMRGITGNVKGLIEEAKKVEEELERLRSSITELE
ncbi:unnamed protein product [Prorocentrum cordatum]|uniref:H(+)-exporting diphosphatase n=1 Tax=Prorocentrum cordatum TaxID=2364126 RepID=A0ABN9WS76_9DINO|nr:unnamed protein product [Polarella glacialis]